MRLLTPMFVTLLVATTLVACNADPGPAAPSDGGRGADGGRGGDAGDAGAPIDAGRGADGGRLDAGRDAGLVSMPCTPMGACNPFMPGACGPMQACRRGMLGAECMDVDAMPRAEGDVCDVPTQCPAGTMCLSFGAEFRCERLCAEGSIGSCGAGRVCTGTIGDVCIQVCRPAPAACDIYAQDCAGMGETCTFVRNAETNAPYTGCRPAGMRAEGQSCGGMDGQCGFDLVCVSSDGATACRQPCRPMASPDECPSGQACSGFARTWMVGYCSPVM